METDEYTFRKMKDFLYVYNKMTETCFNHCVENFNGRELTDTEDSCIEKCSAKGKGVNHKLLMAYIEAQAEIGKKTELQQQQAVIEKSTITSS